MPGKEKVVFPETEPEKAKVALIKETGQLLQEVYKNPVAYHEVVATIYSEYYEDERVHLRDLLYPELSKLYQTPKFKSFKAKAGSFKEAFIKELTKGDYPNLKKAMNFTGNTLALRTNVDTTQQIYSNSEGISIYFPYSENYGGNYTEGYFDSVNNIPHNRYLATIVAADRISDSGPGLRPYICGTRNEPEICYWNVTVNDGYADSLPTHIVGTGVRPRIVRDTPPPGTNVNRVYVGWARINNRQYDKFISFNSANGGGSEIKIGRISAYLQTQNQQVTNFTGDVTEVHFKRKDINKGNWKRIYCVWDADWVPNNIEQIMAVYEEDAEGEETFSGTLGVADTIGGVPVTASVSYEVKVKTQDEIALQLKVTRSSYFGAAKTDQGWGFEMKNRKNSSSGFDNSFLSTGNWPLYNGNGANGSSWNFTWPYNSY
ncbi:MAG TPA: hypothetical protein VFV46_10335 [Lacibacter sp.]|nr:hypothetical protein [Lacibacter sp.]